MGAQPFKGGFYCGAANSGVAPLVEFTVIVQLLVESAGPSGRPVQERKADRLGVHPMDSGHGLQPAPPQLLLRGRPGLLQPSGDGVWRRVRWNTALDLLHCDERTAQVRRVGFVVKDPGHGDLGLVPECVQETILLFKARLQEHRVTGGAYPEGEALALSSASPPPGGIEQQRLGRASIG